MIRKNQQILNLINVLSDAVIVFCAYLFSSWFWLIALKKHALNMAAVHTLRDNVSLAAAIYALAMVVLLAMFRLYNPMRNRPLYKDISAVAKANIIGIVATAALLYLARLEDFSRGVLGIFLLTSTLLLSLKRVSMRHVLNNMRKRGYNQKHVLVVGTGQLARQYARDIEENKGLGLFVHGFVGEVPTGQLPKYKGGFDTLPTRLQSTQIDEVVIALEPSETPLVRHVINECEKSGTKVSVIPFYNDVIPSTPSIEIIGKSKLINLRSTPLENYGYAFIKRLFDILCSLAMLIIVSPIMLIAVIGIKLTSPGPVLFVQKRMGRGKKLFPMFKFRSMCVNAQQDTAWTTHNDKRKTWFGSLLRKCSIDELPQLFNVLRGEMSLVGPRPEIPFYVERFKESIPQYMVKHQVRPGMTGWAQVHGYRGNTSIEKRIEYDIWYIENWSMGLDIRILLRTAFGGWINPEELRKK